MIGNIIDILLVEDNPEDVELTLTALRKHHLANRVQVLWDGAEALEYIFGHVDCTRPDLVGVRPKVIFLDLKLPKVSGLEVLKRIRGDERTNCIPVVILTSSNEDRDRIMGYRLGANSYIVKPVDFDNFANAVAEIGFYWVLLNKSPY